MRLCPRKSTLFPYTTLFRSDQERRRIGLRVRLDLADNFTGQSVHCLILERLRPIVTGGLSCAFRRGAYSLLLRFILDVRSEEHTSELQLPYDLVCRLLLENN